MASAGTVTLDLDANSVKMIRELQKAQKNTKRSAARMQADMGRAFKTIARSAAVMGAAVVAATKLSVDFADRIAKTADKVGVGVEALQEWRFAAKRAGIEQRTLDMAIQRFTRRAGEAAIGTGEAKAAIKELGIELRDSNGNIRSTEALLRDVADAMKKVKSPADRLRLAFKLFDSEGAGMVNVLKEGSEKLDEYSKHARSLGIIMDESLIRNAEKAADKMEDLQQVLAVNIATAVTKNVDAIIALTDAITNLVIAAAKVTTEVPGFVRWMAESAAAAVTGAVAMDDFVRREDEILALEKQLNIELGKKITIFGMEHSGHVRKIKNLEEEITKKKALLQADRDAAGLALGRTTATTTSSPIPAPVTLAPPVLPPPAVVQADADKIADAIKGLMDDVRTFGMTGAEKALINIIDEGATEEQIMLIRQVQDELRLLAEAEEIANAVLEEVVVTAERMPEVIIEASKEMTEFAIQAARNMQTALADFLFDPFDEGLKGMLTGFLTMIRRMVAEALAAQILKSIFGGAEGSENPFLSAIASAFGGARADGGPISPGKAFLVGERGPELIIPRSSGTVVPNDQLASAGSPNITNIINLPPTMDRGTVPQIADELLRAQRTANSRNK